MSAPVEESEQNNVSDALNVNTIRHNSINEKVKTNFCWPFKLFKKGKVIPFEPVECSICLFSIGNKRIYYYNCSHGEFCKSCLDSWKKRGHNCPICRAEAKKKKKKRLHPASRLYRQQQAMQRLVNNINRRRMVDPSDELFNHNRIS